MGFILSCTTTPKRIDNLIQLIPHIKANYKYLVINICAEYRRFGKFKLPKSLLQLCKKNKKIVFNFVNDYGAICKYIGGYNFMKKKDLKKDKLIICDDDILYDSNLFYELMDDKTDENITTGSGFNYENIKYKVVLGDQCEIVEGYGGICFHYNQLSEFIYFYIQFYKHADFKSDNLIDKYLLASFMGDDFILSYEYKNKYACKDTRKYLNPLEYGYGEDALQNNNVFNGNMGTYLFLKNNIKVLDTFRNKLYLNKEIKNNIFYII